MGGDCPSFVVEAATTIPTEIPLIASVASVSDRRVRTAARAFDTISPSYLLKQVHDDRFRHEFGKRHHIGHR